MNLQQDRPDMRIQGTIIRQTPTHRFLRVIVDQELRWSLQYTDSASNTSSGVGFLSMSAAECEFTDRTSYY
jgi:hypothetical protein